MTTEIELPALSKEAARALTDKIGKTLTTLWTDIQNAYLGRAWSALGYASWDEYCQTEFASSRMKLPREERQEVVASLRESGMSTRAIGSALGVDQKTVSNDLRGEENSSPVTGLDGRTYTPREQEPIDAEIVEDPQPGEAALPPVDETASGLAKRTEISKKVDTLLEDLYRLGRDGNDRVRRAVLDELEEFQHVIKAHRKLLTDG